MRLVLTKEYSEEEMLGKRVHELLRTLYDMQDKIVADYHDLLDKPLSAEEIVRWRGHKDIRDRRELVKAAERIKCIDRYTSMLAELTLFTEQDSEEEIKEIAENCANGLYEY